MQNFESILDNDKQLNALDWEPVYHQAIHFPEQVLQAHKKATEIGFINTNIDSIIFLANDIENKLLFQLINYIHGNSLKIDLINEIPQEWKHQNNLLIIPDFDQELTQLPDLDGVIYLTGKQSRYKFDHTVNYSFPLIPANEGLGIFLGFLSGLIDYITESDHSQTINKIAAIGMQKAGVLAWRQPFNNNFAKIWSTRLSQEEGWLITTTEGEFEYICRYWQNKLGKWSGIIPQDKNRIYLAKMFSEADNRFNSYEIIYADGFELISQIISLYYFVNCLAIYTAILKDIDYQEIEK